MTTLNSELVAVLDQAKFYAETVLRDYERARDELRTVQGDRHRDDRFMDGTQAFIERIQKLRDILDQRFAVQVNFGDGA